MQNLLILAATAAALGTALPAAAETKCEQTTKVCTDARTGMPRTCVITTCTDETGTVISTDILVLKEGDTKPPPRKGISPAAPAKNLKTY